MWRSYDKNTGWRHWRLSVPSLQPACMDRLIEMLGLVSGEEHLPSDVLQTPHINIQVNRRSYLLYKLLQMLCLRIAVECVSSLAVNLQIHFLQSGVLWHLLMTLSQ